MPIIATRIVNPPGARRKSKRYPSYSNPRKSESKRSTRTVVAVHTPSGVRYMSGGRFVAASTVKRTTKMTKLAAGRRRRQRQYKLRAMKTATKSQRYMMDTAAARRRARRQVRFSTRRNPASPALKARLAVLRAAGVDVAGAAAKARKKSARATAKAAAPKRRKKTATKRSKTVAKKRRTPPRTKSGRFRKVKHAKTSRRRNPTRRRKTTKRSRRSSPRRNPVSMNPTRRRRSRRRRRNPMVLWQQPTKSGRMRTMGVTLARTSSSKEKGKRYRVRLTKKIHGRRRWAPSIKRAGRNPMSTLKMALPIYGGILAIRIVSGLIKKYVADKYMSTLGAAAPYVPGGLAFLFATLVAPKIKAISSKPDLLRGMQLGATIALGDVLIRNLVQPALLKNENETIKAIGTALAGYDDLGVQGYGYGSYIADPTGYSLPAAHRTMEPGVGLDAHEAMALDEYVSDVGYDVNEALAGDEAGYIQRGGAGGSLSKTVFSS